jgi:hypothetical protein
VPGLAVAVGLAVVTVSAVAVALAVAVGLALPGWHLKWNCTVSTFTVPLVAFGLGPPPGVPKASFLLWLTAVAAGVLETIIRVIDALARGAASGSGGDADVTGAISSVVIRAIVYTLVVYIITRMRLGKRWARLTLAVLLGVIGTLSLVIDPISWLAGGNSLHEVFTEADLLFVLIAPIRAVHLAAVIAALAFMFLPAANTYFRGGRSVTRRTLG